MALACANADRHWLSVRLIPPLDAIILTTQAKWFLSVLTAEYALGIAAAIYYLYINDWQRQQMFYSIVIGIIATFMVTYAFDAVINENRILLLSFFGTAAVYVLMIAYSLYTSTIDEGNIQFFRGVVVFGSICVLITTILGITVWRGFGWRVFYIIGADPVQQSAFRVFMGVNALLKLDVLWTSLLVTFLFWQAALSTVEMVTIVSWLVVTVALAPLLLSFALPAEHRPTLIIYAICSALPMLYSLYALSQLGHFEPSVASEPPATVQRLRFAVIGSLFAFVRILLITSIYMCCLVRRGVLARVLHLWLHGYDSVRAASIGTNRTVSTGALLQRHIAADMMTSRTNAHRYVRVGGSNGWFTTPYPQVASSSTVGASAPTSVHGSSYIGSYGGISYNGHPAGAHAGAHRVQYPNAYPAVPREWGPHTQRSHAGAGNGRDATSYTHSSVASGAGTPHIPLQGDRGSGAGAAVASVPLRGGDGVPLDAYVPPAPTRVLNSQIVGSSHAPSGTAGADAQHAPKGLYVPAHLRGDGGLHDPQAPRPPLRPTAAVSTASVPSMRSGYGDHGGDPNGVLRGDSFAVHSGHDAHLRSGVGAGSLSNGAIGGSGHAGGAIHAAMSLPLPDE